MWGAAKKLVMKEKKSFLDVMGDDQVFEGEEEDGGIGDAKEETVEEDQNNPDVEDDQKVTSLYDIIARFARDKIKKKGHANSDKDGSPRSQDTALSDVLDEEDEVQALAVKEEDLLALRKSIEEIFMQKLKTQNTEGQSYVVRKPKPLDKIENRPSRKVVVARTAPSNARLKKPETAPCGPRYTENGEIIPHSVLGPVRDFVDEALRRNDIRLDSPAVTRTPVERGKLELKKYDVPLPQSRDYIPTSLNQENALRNWRKKMAERKRVQGRISNLLEKPLDRLLMNQDDEVRRILETKAVLDRAIPTVDYGKGYRVGSEFWKQSESIGDDDTGIKMTLTKTERGSPVIFEHVGKSATVQYEVGESWGCDRKTHDPRKTWLESKYLKRRMKQLKPVMTSLDPYKPDLENLEVVGNDQAGSIQIHRHNYLDSEDGHGPAEEKENDPLSGYSDVTSGPVYGPGLRFGGKVAYWPGSSTGNEGKVFSEERICFDCITKEKSYSHIVLENVGTTAIFYEWRKLPQLPSFDAMKYDNVQRFYFNTGEGFILPGDAAKIPIVFKSYNVGIFTETWQLVTKPVLMGGASFQVVLRGIADEDEKTTSEEMEKFDEELRKKEALFDVQMIISDIIKGIQSPERASTPIDAYITEEEIFERKNPGRYYDSDTIMELKKVYLQLFGEDDRDGREWDLSLDELQSCVTAVPDEAAQEELLIELNKIIGRLSFPPLSPQQRLMYSAGYKCWQTTIDRMVSCSMRTRSLMNLPEIIMTEPVTDAELPTTAAAAPPPPSGKADAKDDKKSKGKKGKDAKEEKGKKGKNAGKDARPKSKDPKGKGGKGATPTKDLQPPERDDSKTPSSIQTAPSDGLEPSVRKKYSEKMYGQVYELLVEMVERMSLAFEEAKDL